MLRKKNSEGAQTRQETVVMRIIHHVGNLLLIMLLIAIGVWQLYAILTLQQFKM